MTKFEYKRLSEWIRTEANGWATPNVAARFEAGTAGTHYLEILPFESTIVTHPFAIELIDLFERTGVGRGTLLDYGCGNGACAKLLAEARLIERWRYVGVDINRMSVESCRRRFPNARFEVATEGETIPSRNNPFPDEFADLVLASGVLESVEDPASLLKEFRRVSKSWVALCRIGMRPSEPSVIYRQTVQHAWGIEEHCQHVFNQTELEEMIAGARFEIIRCELSAASGEWLAPDDPTPLQYYSYLLRKN